MGSGRPGCRQSLDALRSQTLDRVRLVELVPELRRQRAVAMVAAASVGRECRNAADGVGRYLGRGGLRSYDGGVAGGAARALAGAGMSPSAGVSPVWDADLPRPWRITDGPHCISQSFVDGTAWLFTLERDGAERALIVAVSSQARRLAAVKQLPVETREAIRTDGRSEAARIAQLDDPAKCVVLDSNGYLPAPPGLALLARS